MNVADDDFSIFLQSVDVNSTETVPKIVDQQAERVPSTIEVSNCQVNAALLVTITQ